MKANPFHQFLFLFTIDIWSGMWIDFFKNNIIEYYEDLVVVSNDKLNLTELLGTRDRHQT